VPVVLARNIGFEDLPRFEKRQHSAVFLQFSTSPSKLVRLRQRSPNSGGVTLT